MRLFISFARRRESARSSWLTLVAIGLPFLFGLGVGGSSVSAGVAVGAGLTYGAAAPQARSLANTARTAADGAPIFLPSAARGWPVWGCPWPCPTPTVARLETASPTASPSGTALVTTTPTSEPGEETPEEGALRALAGIMGWTWPEYDVRTDGACVIYRVEQSIMAGASDGAEIQTCDTEASAAAAFGEAGGEFAGLPARRASGASYYAPAAHYQEQRWLTWYFGLRVFGVWTGYNSTVCGGATDPERVGWGLLDVAMAEELLPGYALPLPTAWATCPVPLAVEPISCSVESAQVDVSGDAGADCEVVVSGGERPVTDHPTGSMFQATVALRELQGHRLSVSSTCGGCQTVRTQDRTGRDLLVYRLPAPRATPTTFATGGDLPPSPRTRWAADPSAVRWPCR